MLKWTQIELLLRIARQVSRFAFDSIRKQTAAWIFVGEGTSWSINHEGWNTLNELGKLGYKTGFVYYPAFVRGDILHFGSLPAYRQLRKRFFCTVKKVGLTCFHGDFGVSAEMDLRLRHVIKDKNQLDFIIVSNKTMYQRFVGWGIDERNLHLIPVGVDTELFKSATAEERATARSRLGLPANVKIIGSFQKDGNGWGEGYEPKLIKGPDVFCDVVEAISKALPLHVLLTGPARGYVEKRLDAAGIGYTHHLLESPNALPDYYLAIDCYLMCSREEGGPKSIPESLATGTPFVATRTGVVPDVESEFGLGWYCDVDDRDCLVAQALDAFTNTAKREEFILAAPQYATRFSWENIGKAYLDVYKGLIG
ncbi:MAG: glycosyltransferase family 4 protein [Candidatus Scalindua sp.]